MPKKIDDSINGLTGEALLEKVYEIIEQHKDEYSKCKAILIEDDLDGRFEEYSQEQMMNITGNDYLRSSCTAGKDVPVFIM